MWSNVGGGGGTAGGAAEPVVRAAMHDFRGEIPPLFSAERTDHVDGGCGKTFRSGEYIVAAFFAANHAALGEWEGTHGYNYRGIKGEDQGQIRGV